MNMKPLDGIETVKIITEQFPGIKVMILSTFYKPSFIGYMIGLGVCAFLPKNITKNELNNAIESVHKNGIYFTENENRLIRFYLANPNQKPPVFNMTEEFSKRELEVLKLICEQNTNIEIADKLFISKRTVEAHRNKLLEKTGAKNTVGLVLFAIVNNLIHADEKIIRQSFY